MSRMFANILETDQYFYEVFVINKTTMGELLEKVVVDEKWRCSVDELSLYLASKNGRQLHENEPEYLDLFQGKLSDGVREIMNEANRIDPDTQIRKFYDPRGTYRNCLLEIPPRIRRKYRKSVAATRRRYIELGLATAEDADLESDDELNWWQRLLLHP